MFRIAFLNRPFIFKNSRIFDSSLQSAVFLSSLLSLFAPFSYANSPANSLVNTDTYTFVIGDTVILRPLDNDQRSSLNTNTFYISSPPQRGYIRVRDDYSLSYTNYGSASTSDSFTYRIADYNGNLSDPVSVNLSTRSPSAQATTQQNGSVSGSDINVSVGGSATLNLLIDSSSYNLSTLWMTTPGNGYTTIPYPGAVKYQHYAQQGRTDTFDYSVADYNGNYIRRTISVSIGGNNPQPTTTTQQGGSTGNNTNSDLNVAVGGSGTIDLPIDSSSFNLSTLWTTTPANGYTTIPYQGAVKYQHYASKGRTDSFDYSVADYNGNYTRKTITVSIGNGGSPSSTSTSNTTTTTSNSGWWQPRASDNLKWQLQLQGDIRLISGVKVYAADSTVSQASINAAKATGAKLKCYLSAGSAENFRNDYSSIPSYVIGNVYQGWPGERWLNTRDISALAPVMRARMDTCKRKGFDAIDADNVNGFENNTGFNLSRRDSIAYIRWLAAESHARGMAFSLKNSESLIDDVIDHVDMLQTESCYVYSNCGNARKMSARNKAVFAVEYQQNMNSSSFRQNVCPAAAGYNFSMIYRDLLLTPGGVYLSCN